MHATPEHFLACTPAAHKKHRNLAHRCFQIFGPESSGKTTVALHAMAEVQRQGGLVALIDAEHAFDPSFAKASTMQTE